MEGLDDKIEKIIDKNYYQEIDWEDGWRYNKPHFNKEQLKKDILNLIEENQYIK